MPNFKSIELNQILRAELAFGNSIVEVASWLPTCNKLIILRNKFKHKFSENTNDVVFKELNDKHYWFAEYRTMDGSECLACGFN